MSTVFMQYIPCIQVGEPFDWSGLFHKAIDQQDLCPLVTSIRCNTGGTSTHPRKVRMTKFSVIWDGKSKQKLIVEMAVFFVKKEVLRTVW
jgi:hypothetical protein